MGFLYRTTPKWVTLFHLFFQVLCIYYQPNLWLSRQEHLGSFWEVSELNTRLNFDFFSFKFFKFFKFLNILLFLNFSKNWANLEFIPINLMIFKAPPVQVWSSCCTGLTYFPPPSHCDQCPLHQSILLTQGPIHEIFTKFFWELEILKFGHFEKRPFWKKI